MGTCRVETSVHVWAVPGRGVGGGEGQTLLGAGTLEMQLSGSGSGPEKGEGSEGGGSEAVRGLRKGGCSERGERTWWGEGDSGPK